MSRRRTRDRMSHDADRAAFGALLRTHDPRLRNLVWRMVHADRATTDDLLQDAYLRAFRSRDSFTGDADAFGAWLFRITYNLCLDHLKSAKRRVDPAGHDLSLALVSSNGEPLLSDRVVERDRVRSALAQLGPDEIAAIVLIDLEGVPYEEAADLLDVPLGTLSSRVGRARRRLRAALEETSEDRRPA